MLLDHLEVRTRLGRNNLFMSMTLKKARETSDKRRIKFSKTYDLETLPQVKRLANTVPTIQRFSPRKESLNLELSPSRTLALLLLL